MQAGRSARAKYLTPYLATKYSIAMEGMGPNAVLNPARQGLTMVPTGGMPKELALTHADAQGYVVLTFRADLAGIKVYACRPGTCRASECGLCRSLYLKWRWPRHTPAGWFCVCALSSAACAFDCCCRAAKVMELAATLQEAEKQRAAKAAEARKRNIVVAAARPPPPRPASASFKSTTREQVGPFTRVESGSCCCTLDLRVA